MRRLAAACVATVLAVAGLTGCGIPDETDVATHGPGPTPGVAPGGESLDTPSARTATADPLAFVENYLAVAAGDPAKAVDRVREWIAPASRPAFKPSADINVVRLVEKSVVSSGTDEVRLKVQHVGVLGATGALEPPAAGVEIAEYRLVVTRGSDPADGLFISNPPKLLLLSDTALANFYETRPIYFWNLDSTALVPDLRWLPKEQALEKGPTQIVDALTAGPSPWLKDAVLALPPDTKRTDNVPYRQDGRLQVSLSGPADDAAVVDRLGRQLRWSFGPDPTKELELRIGNNNPTKFADDSYLASNPAAQLATVSERFCLYDGKVRRLAASARPTDAVPVPDELNRDVRAAALSRSGGTVYAALVAANGAGQRLVLTATRDGIPVTRTPELPKGAASRPVWLSGWANGEPGGGVGVLAVGGRLYSFMTNGVAVEPVDLPAGLGPVTAVGAAPDGHRIAFVAGGRLYVSVLTADANRLKAGPPRRVQTSLSGVTGVDWSSEETLVVAGTRVDTGRVTIIDITVDGGVETARLNGLGTAAVTDLAAYPANPLSRAAVVVYQVDGVAYDLFNPPESIDAADLVGAPAAGGDPVRPVAPFFLE